MNWAESFAILFGLIGLAMVFHGLPKITIGGQHHHYIKEKEEE